MRHFHPTLATALVVWLAVSLVATFLASQAALAGLAVGAAGGALFGWLSARSVDPRRVRIGRRRRSQDASPE